MILHLLIWLLFSYKTISSKYNTICVPDIVELITTEIKNLDNPVENTN